MFTHQKNQLIEEAVEWKLYEQELYCMEAVVWKMENVENVRGCKALETFFPVIKDRETINHRWDGKIKTG